MESRFKKVCVHLAVVLIAAAVGLAAGMVLRSKRLAKISGSAAANLKANSTQLTNYVRVLGQTPLSRAGDDSPLSTRLESNLANSSGVTRWLYWLEALEKATPSDFPRLARLAENNPAALQFVAARWAEIAPRQMFDFLVASARNGSGTWLREMVNILFRDWPKRDPEAAIAALNEPSQNGMGWSWRDDVATTVINNDIERGLRLFEQWHIGNYMPFADSHGPVPKWASADPRHAAEFAVAHPSGYLSQGVMTAIGEEWAKTDPAGALQFAAANPGELGSGLGTAALKTWAERDLNSAADWLSSADAPIRNRLSSGFVEAWAKKDAVAALDWSEENLHGSS